MTHRSLIAGLGMLWLTGCCAPAASRLTSPATAVGVAITGRVFVAGPVPVPRMIQRAGPEPRLGPIADPAVRVAADGAVADVVVEVTDAPRDAAARAPSTWPAGPVVVTMRDQLYDPLMVVVRVGQRLRFESADGERLYNPHLFDRFSESHGLPQRTSPPEFTYEAPERFKVKCDIHPWMSMGVAVVDHPYAVVTDAAGRFTLPPLPPGRYTLSAWHPRLGVARAEVTLPSAAPGGVELRLAREPRAGATTATPPP